MATKEGSSKLPLKQGVFNSTAMPLKLLIVEASEGHIVFFFVDHTLDPLVLALVKSRHHNSTVSPPKTTINNIRMTSLGMQKVVFLINFLVARLSKTLSTRFQFNRPARDVIVVSR